MSSLDLFPPLVADYVTARTREGDVAKRLRTETAQLPSHGMQTTPDQVAFLAMMVRMLGAKHVIEIGTYTGYSTLAMAEALATDGKIIACDVSEEWTAIAKRHWRAAGVENRIDLHIAPALETLTTLISEAAGTFDFAFIDADKTGYDAYYEACLKLLRVGGVIAFDNMLWGGAVADNSVHDGDTEALRALNLKIQNDNRVDSAFLTVADGVMLARKR